MNLYHLRYFVTLAHLEHYTKAAIKLNTTQPNLSYAISSLETELGISLFEKEGRNIVLTKYGREFLLDVEHSLSILDASIQRMQLIGKGEGVIELGFLRFLGIKYIPDTISGFLKNYPENSITFNFHAGITADFIQLLKEKRCDIVFCSFAENEPDIEFTPVATQDLVLIVQNGHPLCAYDEVDLSATLPYPQIFFNKRSGLRRIVKNLFKKIDAVPNIIMEIEEDQVIAGFVAAGFGIAIVPDMPILSQLNVKKIAIKNPSWERRFYMATLKKQYHAPVVYHFMEYIKSLPKS